MLVRPISHLLAEATAAGAAFRVSGAKVGVTDPSAIPAEVRTTLKDRRDELFAHLTSADTGGPTSSAILQAEGIEVVVATTERKARGKVALLEELQRNRQLGTQRPNEVSAGGSRRFAISHATNEYDAR